MVTASFTVGQAQSKPIKIGQVIPITGEAAESGRYHRQGAELAAEKINAAGGIKRRKITIVFEDDQTTNIGAIAALQWLLGNKEIPMVLGSVRSTQVQAMLPTINEVQRPVAIGGTSYPLTHSGSRWVFRFRPHDGMSAKVIAKFVVEDLKLKKVAVVHASDVFGNGGRDMVTAALKELGAEVVMVDRYNNGEKEFSRMVQDIKNSGAKALVTYMTYEIDLVYLARELKRQRTQVTWIGSTSITTVDARKQAGDALYGTYGVADFHVDASPTSKAFAGAYKAKYGEEPDVYAAWCYDAMLVFGEAMKNAPDLKPESLRKTILEIKKFPGAEGEYNFDGNGDGLDHYHVVQNDKGVIKLFKTLHVAR
jgi:branched-chain amino acid transport system substrate-binding protein